MCRNTHWIYNKFIRRSILVDCGKCPTCLQKKAVHRVNRIRNNYADGQLVVFVTLTYRNECVPYVFRKDFQNGLPYIKVHRNSSCRYNRVGRGSSYRQALSFCYRRVVLDEFYFREYFEQLDSDYVDYLSDLRDLKDYPGRIGVCYYPDLQDFYKRLRQNLKRHYNYDGIFTTYNCSEYGGKTQRPHFHLLLFIDPKDWEIFRSAIDESWPFNDKRRCPLYIDVARDAASYVSSYVNCSSSLSKVLQTPCFRQKHSYSKGFGLALVSFSLAQIRSKIVSGDLSYYSRKVVDGKSIVSSFPIPEYVINRYYPKFKGYSRIAPDTLFKYIYKPETISELRLSLDYSPDDERSIFVALTNAFSRWQSETGLSRYDYALEYCRVWSIHSSTVLRGSFDLVRDVFDWYSYYDNASDYVSGLVRSWSLDGLAMLERSNYQINPNDCKHRVMLQNRLEPLFNKLCKQKNVTNVCMAESGLEV